MAVSTEVLWQSRFSLLFWGANRLSDWSAKKNESDCTATPLPRTAEAKGLANLLGRHALVEIADNDGARLG